MRLDKFLVEKGLVRSREEAQALIMQGLVTVNGKIIDKAGYRLKGDERVDVKERMKYVSRGGYKLEHALEKFNIKVKSLIAMDVGSSTGGFTDCLLQKGALKVYAIDVGKGQMDFKLRQDSRVILFEKLDARKVSDKEVPEKVDIITVDVSFISLCKVLPNIVRFLKEEGLLLVLVKPQFELSPRKVKKGIVKENKYKEEAIRKVIFCLKELGFYIKGIIKAKPKGTKGNEEFFVYSTKEKPDINIEYEIGKAINE